MSGYILTTIEQAALEHCERIISQGLQTFLEVGRALATVREQRLYRASTRTFEDYCSERWNIAASRARQLIAASEVVDNLQSDTMVTVLPTNERQARELAVLPPDQQAAVWTEVIGTGKPTAARVKAAVKAKRRKKKPVDMPRLLRLAAMHRILTSARTLLDEDLGEDRNLPTFNEIALESAGYDLLESECITKLVVRVTKMSGGA